MRDENQSTLALEPDAEGTNRNANFPSSVLLIFVDGLGIGSRTKSNPLHLLGNEAVPLAVFDNENAATIYDGLIVPTDATLGVEGRPQSASGQTTILTGINVPQLLGFHKHGFPNLRMRELLLAHSLFLQLKRRSIEPNIFANAYSPKFFAERPRWVSTSTVAVEAANMKFLTLDDVREGRALYHDWSNRVLIEAGYQVPSRTAEEAASILVRAAHKHRFTLYEYFLTDRAGHAQDVTQARRSFTPTRALCALGSATN